MSNFGLAHVKRAGCIIRFLMSPPLLLLLLIPWTCFPVVLFTCPFKGICPPWVPTSSPRVAFPWMTLPSMAIPSPFPCHTWMLLPWIIRSLPLVRCSGIGFPGPCKCFLHPSYTLLHIYDTLGVLALQTAILMLHNKQQQSRWESMKQSKASDQGRQHNPPEQLIYMCFEGLALWFLGSPGVLLTPSSCARATNSTTRLCEALPHPSPPENKIVQLWVFLKLHACSTWIWLLSSDPTTSSLDSWRQPGEEHGKVLIPGQILVQSWECACEEKQSAIAALFQ